MAFHENPGGVDRFRSQRALLDDLFHFRNHAIRRRRHDRIKIPRGLAIDQVSPAVALPRFDESEIPAKRAFKNVISAAKLANFFPTFRESLVPTPVGV